MTQISDHIKSVRLEISLWRNIKIETEKNSPHLVSRLERCPKPAPKLKTPFEKD